MVNIFTGICLYFYADDFRQYYVNEKIFLVCNSIFVGYDENYHGNLVRECCETCISRSHGNRTEQTQNRNVNFEKICHTLKMAR